MESIIVVRVAGLSSTRRVRKRRRRKCARRGASALVEGNVAADLNVAARIRSVVARGDPRKTSLSWLTSSTSMVVMRVPCPRTTITTRCLMEMEDGTLKSMQEEKIKSEESRGKKGRVLR